MDISVITQYLVIPVVVACFLIGFVVKNYTKIPNKFIPLIMLVAGIIINVLINIPAGTFSMICVIQGGLSGWASTGLHETIAKTIGYKNTSESDTTN